MSSQVTQAEAGPRQYWYKVCNSSSSNTDTFEHFGAIEGEGLRLLSSDGRTLLRIKFRHLSHFTIKDQCCLKFKNRSGTKQISVQFRDLDPMFLFINRIQTLVHTAVTVNCLGQTKFVIQQVHPLISKVVSLFDPRYEDPTIEIEDENGNVRVFAFDL